MKIGPYFFIALGLLMQLFAFFWAAQGPYGPIVGTINGATFVAFGVAAVFYERWRDRE